MTNLTRTQFQSHPFHMVEPSPWPLLTSFAILTMTVSGVLYFNGIQHGEILLTLGFLSTLTAMILWFRDIITEGTYLGDHTFAVQKGITMGVALFILSEAFFFLSIFWAYFHSALAPTVELGGHWPPAGIEALNPFAIPLLNTILLLSSGATVTYAHHALIEGNRRGAIIGTAMTLVFAIVFTALQGVEYAEAGFTIADGVYGSVFYFSTGFHSIHVMIGTAMIGVAFFRIINYHVTDHHHLGFESSILYWHFVDVVWLFLYIVVYWWGGDGEFGQLFAVSGMFMASRNNNANSRVPTVEDSTNTQSVFPVFEGKRHVAWRVAIKGKPELTRVFRFVPRYTDSDEASSDAFSYRDRVLVANATLQEQSSSSSSDVTVHADVGVDGEVDDSPQIPSSILTGSKVVLGGSVDEVVNNILLMEDSRESLDDVVSRAEEEQAYEDAVDAADADSAITLDDLK